MYITLQGYQLDFYRRALPIAQRYAEEAELASNEMAFGPRGSRGEYPTIVFPPTPVKDYWKGFIQGLEDRIEGRQFDENHLYRLAAQRFDEYQSVGYKAGYDFFELRGIQDTRFNPPTQEGLEFSRIKWEETL